MLIPHCSRTLVYVLWVFWCLSSAPLCLDLLVDVQAGMRIWKSLLFVTYWPTFAWQLTNQSHQSMLCVCLCVCIYTPSSATSLHGAPQEASRALPHLHSSWQLGTWLTGSFSPLCMERHSSNTEEQPGTQSGFIISCLLSLMYRRREPFSECVWLPGTRHGQTTADDMYGGICWLRPGRIQGERRGWAARQSCVYIALAISPLSGWELCLGLVADCFDVKWFHFMRLSGSQTTGMALLLLSHGQSGLG